MAITDNRTTRSTRATYTRLMKHVYAWLQVNYPDSCEDGRILLPLNEDAVMTFVGGLCEPAWTRDKCRTAADIPEGTEEPLSLSYVKGYRSACVDAYTRAGLIMDQQLDQNWITLLRKFFCFIEVFDM